MPNQTFFNAYESNLFEHYSQAPKTECAASYNTEDPSVNPHYICPENQPNCVGYQGGSVWGTCEDSKPTPTETIKGLKEQIEGNGVILKNINGIQSQQPNTNMNIVCENVNIKSNTRTTPNFNVDGTISGNNLDISGRISGTNLDVTGICKVNFLQTTGFRGSSQFMDKSGVPSWYGKNGQWQKGSYPGLGIKGQVDTGSDISKQNLGIFSKNGIMTNWFITFSSKKLKDVHDSVQNSKIMKEVIDLFKKIPLSKYTYKNKLSQDDHVHYGLIAEDMPDNIYTYSKGSDYVPNILQVAKVVHDVDSDMTSLHFEKPIDFSKIENYSEIKVSTKYDQEFDLKEVAVITENHIQGILPKEETHHEELFVYGSKEKIPSVQKESYFELTSCIVKYLLEKVESLEEKISILEKNAESKTI